MEAVSPPDGMHNVPSKADVVDIAGARSRSGWGSRLRQQDGGAHEDVLEVTCGRDPRRLALEWPTDDSRPDRIMPDAASRCDMYGDRESTHFCRRGSACDLHHSTTR